MPLKSLRALATTAAGVWLGGMILIAIVAQTTFGTMRNTGVDQPNSVAGQVMARNFSRFDTVQSICAGVLVCYQALALIVGERSRQAWLRLGLILAASGLLLYGVLVLTPKIQNFQSAVVGPNAENAAKAIFDAFHASAVRVSKINLALVFLIALSLAWPSGRARMDGGNGGEPLRL